MCGIGACSNIPGLRGRGMSERGAGGFVNKHIRTCGQSHHLFTRFSIAGVGKCFVAGKFHPQANGGNKVLNRGCKYFEIGAIQHLGHFHGGLMSEGDRIETGPLIPTIKTHHIFETVDGICQPENLERMTPPPQPHVHKKERHARNVIGMKMRDNQVCDGIEAHTRALKAQNGIAGTVHKYSALTPRNDQVGIFMFPVRNGIGRAEDDYFCHIYLMAAMAFISNCGVMCDSIYAAIASKGMIKPTTTRAQSASASIRTSPTVRPA